jgi:hypothetical protein
MMGKDFRVLWFFEALHGGKFSSPPVGHRHSEFDARLGGARRRMYDHDRKRPSQAESFRTLGRGVQRRRRAIKDPSSNLIFTKT